MTATYHIWTIGCQMNVADSQRLASELEMLGYVWSDRAEDADVVVLNTCVVRQQAENKVYGRLGSLARQKSERPGSVLCLMGCLVGHQPPSDLVQRFPHVDIFLRPSETAPLVDLLRGRHSEADARQAEARARARRSRYELDNLSGTVLLPSTEIGRLVSTFVPIVLGCSKSCAYCIIPSRRGPEYSRPAAQVVNHVVGLVRQGIREVTLLGQIVDRYGHDRGEKDALSSLLRELAPIEGLERIRFLTNHPTYLSDELLRTVALLPQAMEHLEVPVQAGHDKVLSRMRRGYRVDDYRRLVEKIRTLVPGAAIHTDVIVGFPGETDEEFAATAALLEELELDKAHVAKFSPRPGTVAALKYEDDVPAEVKEERRRALDELQRAINARKNGARVGEELEVLVEGSDRGRWRGRTRTNRIVFFDDARDLLGRRVMVRIEWAGPWSMVGRSVAGTEVPRSSAPLVDSAYAPD